MRDHLRASGKLGPEDDPAALFPETAAHIWSWFCDLSAARTSSGFGANPLSYSEIGAWARLTGSLPRAWEIRAIREIDDLYLAANASQD